MKRDQFAQCWYSFVRNNPDKIKFSSTAVMFAIFEIYENQNHLHEFTAASNEIMQLAAVSNYATLCNSIRDLQELGFIKIVRESTNRYSHRIITFKGCDNFSSVPSFQI